jgi:hypothetical protein
MPDKSHGGMALPGHRDEPFDRTLNEQVYESSAGAALVGADHV